MSGFSAPEWANEEFTLYVSHMFKHVPAKMVFSIFRNMGLGMLKRGDEAISFRDHSKKENAKSAKINFKFVFTRGDDAENNIQILEHLRSGGPDAHIQVTYQAARRNPKTGKDEPDRYWKVSLWRDRARSPEQRSKPRKSGPAIALSGGKLGKEKKVVARKIKLMTPASGAGAPKGGAPGAPKKGPKKGVRAKARSLPPLDLSGLDGPASPTKSPSTVSPATNRQTNAESGFRLGCSSPEAGSSPKQTFTIQSPDYHPTSPGYTATSPPYCPTSPAYQSGQTYTDGDGSQFTPHSPGLLYMNANGSQVTADGAPYLPPSPDYSPPKSPEPKKSVTFSDEDEVHEIPARSDEPSLPRCDADHRDDSPEVPANPGFISLAAKEMPGDDVEIVFDANQRRKGTAVWARYEKYQVATTIKEARALGATAADIKKDFEKGWFCLAAP